MASYPNSLPSFPTPGATLSSPSHTALHSSADGEIVAICTELGTLPKGGYSSVAARLTGIESSIVGTGHTQNTDLGTTSTTFYIGGGVGPRIKTDGTNFSLRNHTDASYVDLTVANFTVPGNITDGMNTVTVAQIATSILNDHTHANKATLDTYSQTEANLADAVVKKHTQNTDTGTTSETFQMNNVNPLNSAKIKVDDLTPQYVDIRNAADSNFADIRADHFKGELAPLSDIVPSPYIKYDLASSSWVLCNDGLSPLTIAAGCTLAGVGGNVQFNSGAGNLAADPLFTYNDGTNTLSVPNLVATVSATIAGTTYDTFTVNTDSFYFQIDTTGMGANRVANGEDLYQAAQQRHNIATAGAGISIGGGSGQVITNSSPDQTVSIGNSTHVTVGGAYPAFTLSDNAQTGHANLTSLSGLTYVSASFVKMTGANTFTLDTNTYQPAGSYLTTALTDTYIFVGNGSNVATGVQMTGDVTISNTGVTTVGNDSHNHTVTTVSLSLDDLNNVTVPAPSLDDYLRWNGAAWVNVAGSSVSAGPSTIFYLDNDAQAGAYQTLLMAPDTVTPEEQDSVVVNNSEGLIGGYLYNTALSNTTIPSGIWEFDFFAYVSTASGVSTLLYDVYKVVADAGTVAITGAGTSRTATVTGTTPFVGGDANADAHLASYLQTPNGTFQITGFTSTSVVTIATDNGYVNESGVSFTIHRVLFSAESAEIDTLTTPGETIKLSAQAAFSISATDKLALRVWGKTTNVGNVTIYIAHNSTDHYSHMHSPLAITHNDLSGLQGGTGGQYYHLTNAQVTALHDAVTVTDSASIDFTLSTQQITAVVLPGGVDHNSLNNYSANRHYDHTAISVSAGTGLTGGGTIAADRTISLSHLGIESLADPGANTLMGWDDTDNATKWITIGTNLSYDHASHTLSATGGATLTRATFTNASLSSGILTITHSKGLSAPYTVLVMIFDNNYQQVIPDSVTGATNSVAVDLSSYVTAGGGSISGTWGYGYIA